MPRVLVIEDSPTQSEHLASILEDAGFDVETAPDAERGLGCLVGGGIDVVLSDLHLPGDSGFDLCRRLKADPRLRRVPIVVCTSEADPFNVLRGLEAGADGFMTKDREPAEIVAVVRRALANAATAGDAPSIGVSFLGREFSLSAGREQLLDIMVTAFEDVVHLNRRWIEAARSERRAHEELRRAHEELKQAEAQLVQSEKLSSLGRTAAGVAHEINNPLAFVISNVAVLGRDLGELRDLIHLYQQGDAALAEHRPELYEAIRRLVDQIDLAETLEGMETMAARSGEGLRRIQQIVKDLRAFARLDESELDAVDLGAAVRSTMTIARGLAAPRGVGLELDPTPLPPVICHPAQINQVVMNLVSNAIEACAPGGRVTVATRQGPGGVEIHVTDDGRGIEPAIRDKIFDPFFTTKPVGQGTGLGLSISYGIIKDHGGSIDVESEPGRGTRFVVRLPCTAAGPDPSPPR